MTEFRILLVDDDASTRKGLRMLLQCEPGVVVTGEAPNGLAALRQIEALVPDLVLIDVRMPGMDGIACAREIARRYPRVSVLFLSLYDDSTSRALAAEAGALGFIAKQAITEDLLPAIRAFVDNQAARR